MLLEEQVAELLCICETTLDIELRQIRGNLKQGEHRAAAIWELMVIDVLSRIGKVEYEPNPNGSPDVCLTIGDGRAIWIEIAYLYPRFWKQELQSDAVLKWICNDLRRRNIPPWKVIINLDGVDTTGAGPVRNLPKLNEKNLFMKKPEIETFFSKIYTCPDCYCKITSPEYSITLIYDPERPKTLPIWKGAMQESPTSIKQHALYRLLKAKARQHKVVGPYLVFIGSDQSPVIGSIMSNTSPSVKDVTTRAFMEYSSLSGVIIANIENRLSALSSPKKRAELKVIVNPNAKNMLHMSEIQLISKLNFNKWKFTSALTKDNKNQPLRSRVTGSISWEHTKNGNEIVQIPTNIVAKCLTGDTTLKSEYNLIEGPMCARILERDVISNCLYKAGNVCMDEAPKFVFELEVLKDFHYTSSVIKHWRSKDTDEHFVEIPANIILDCLIGGVSLQEACGTFDNLDFLYKVLNRRKITGCYFVGRDLEKLKSPSIVIKFGALYTDCFWPSPQK